MRILFLGDLVGRAGRQAAIDRLPGLIARGGFDFVVVNGENAAGGFGITEAITAQVLDAGADCVTLGNHAWDQKEALVFIAREPRLLRPLNFPPGTPGRGANLFEVARGPSKGARVLVAQVMGRVFMDALDDPFRAADEAVESAALGRVADAILVDIHAEATSEKQALGHMLDGRASLVVGTHTHVPTADHQILPGGTAYCSDAGMCGDYDSVLGMDKEEPIQRFRSKIPASRFTPSSGAATVCGVAVETDDATGLARAVSPVRVGGRLSQAWPDWAV
ncbi:MAG: TIGR00282 family metallophosphoesterase [Pseudomonadota bacterium]